MTCIFITAPAIKEKVLAHRELLCKACIEIEWERKRKVREKKKTKTKLCHDRDEEKQYAGQCVCVWVYKVKQIKWHSILPILKL